MYTAGKCGLVPVMVEQYDDGRRVGRNTCSVLTLTVVILAFASLSTAQCSVPSGQYRPPPHLPLLKASLSLDQLEPLDQSDPPSMLLQLKHPLTTLSLWSRREWA